MAAALDRFGDLHLDLDKQKKRWVLGEEFTYLYVDKASGTRVLIRVPKNFETDLDSVPRIPLAYTWLKNRARCSAVVHDWLYFSQAGKAYADKVFLAAMRDEGVPLRYRWPIYWGVVLGGCDAYREHGRRQQTIA